MNYTVKYKRAGAFFWKTIKNVKGDGYVENGNGSTKNIRWFILSDESRLEMPADGIIFKYSKERYFSIKQYMEQQTGKNI